MINNFSERIESIRKTFNSIRNFAYDPYNPSIKFDNYWEVLEYYKKTEYEIFDPYEDPAYDFKQEGYSLLQGSFDDLHEGPIAETINENALKTISSGIDKVEKLGGRTGGEFTFDFTLGGKTFKGKGWWSAFDGYWFYLKWDDMLKLKPEFEKIKL